MSKAIKNHGNITKKGSDLKDSKVYRVTIGMVYEFDNDSDDVSNFSSETVVAKDAIQAADKVKLSKDQYIAEVELVIVLTQ